MKETSIYLRNNVKLKGGIKVAVKDLLNYIDKSPNCYYAVENLVDKLEEAGYKEVGLTEKWQLENGGKYYVKLYHSSCIAFQISEKGLEEFGFKMITAHTDSPALKIKPNPEIKTQNYVKLNVEVYGGPILFTWLDRPLSIAGKVALKSDNPLKPHWKLLNFKKPLLTIPNLAIHMNRKVNEGVELNKQIDMQPILTLIKDEMEHENYLSHLIAKELDVNIDDILDFDLYLYPTEESCLLGVENDIISAPRLDDLCMVHAGLEALLHSEPKVGINMLVTLDNEEIGSRTKQGADSPLLSMILEKICLALGYDRDGFFNTLFESFMISADMAHAIHPNRPEKHDPVNQPKMNKGPVIKYNANYKYASDSTDACVYAQVCKNADIPIQKYVNRSDEPGGSTIGAVNAGNVPVRTVDIGAAMLAMHSLRETMGAEDYEYLVQSFKAYYNL